MRNDSEDPEIIFARALSGLRHKYDHVCCLDFRFWRVCDVHSCCHAAKALLQCVPSDLDGGCRMKPRSARSNSSSCASNHIATRV